jgi:molybdate transport system substrate-binding protein
MRKRRILSLMAGILVIFLVVVGCNQIETKNQQQATLPVKAQPVTLTVAAAADLNYVFQEIGALWEQETGNKIQFNFGSTGQLTEQIQQGAPIDLFAAANRSFIERLEKEDAVIPDTKKLYGRGRITMWMPKDSPLDLKDIQDLTKPEVKQVAIANPAHAPYGIAAREALQSAGIWEQIQPKLIFGENVRQTHQYAVTGNVDVSITALSLSVIGSGRWVLIPESLHQPLDQVLAVIKNTPHEEQARHFAEFINGEQGRPLMQKYGFILPGEEAT